MKTKIVPQLPPPADTIYGVDVDGPPLMRVKEVCAAIRQRPQFVYDRVQEGTLLALRRPGSKTSNLNVVRASVVAYLARSAEGVTEQDYADALLFLWRRLPQKLRADTMQKMQEVCLC